MIAQLRGQITHKTDAFAIVDVAGIGYQVFLKKDTLFSLEIRDAVMLWTYLAVRDDALLLYGFMEHDEFEMFEALLSLPGIGPKSAMTILSAADPATIKKAVVNQDPPYLTSVSGIGRKNAEKIVQGLKEKLGAMETTESPKLKEEADVIEAIKSLGFSSYDAREALRHIPQDVIGVSQKIKEALKHLGKKS